MAILSYIEAVTKALKDEMQRDEKVFVIGEDVGVRGGVFRATDGLIDLFGEERVIDSPLSEALIVGASVGAAAYGMRPVAEIQFADFIMPAVNQMVSEAAKMRYRSNNDWHCPLVVRAPYGGGVHGALYHSQCVESFFSGVAGLKIVM
ncbi:MAG: alpha-ketoacid dehydrogenase subunit beta, partial [Novibacillus thermophilus]